MKTLPALAILDWGIGGFGLVAALNRQRQQQPQVAYTYFSDSGFAPYGKVAPQALALRLAQLARFLHERGVRELAIACNAASTVASEVDWPAGLVVHDVITAGLALCLDKPARHLGIVGGRRTIVSRALATPLRQAGIMVSQRVAQPLSAHIERGNLDGADLHADLEHILKPLRDVDALLLACTHYPAIAPAFQRLLPKARLIDPIDSLLGKLRLDTLGEGKPCILTTGDAGAMAHGAQAAFGVEIAEQDIECVSLAS